MADTLALHITIQPRQPWADILVAQLSEMGFDAFEDTDNGLVAYGPEPQINLQAVKQKTLLAEEAQQEHEQAYHSSYHTEIIPFQNWNAAWEAGFEPVDVEGKLRILAPFHEAPTGHEMIIRIQPHMSFGTGHHQTTWLMSKAMLDLPAMPDRVLDMGTGTGVLAILAEKRGASHILAIDIEDWSVENTIENAERNQCQHIEALCGDVELISGKVFDLILANINKNVLKQHLAAYFEASAPGGSLFLSGFFASDAPEMIAFAEQTGYRHQETLTRETWAMLRLIKP